MDDDCDGMCNECGEVAYHLTTVTALRADAARYRKALEGIRDRYVKMLPGKERPTCTLCGRDDGTHDGSLNCGVAEAGLSSALTDPGGGPAGNPRADENRVGSDVATVEATPRATLPDADVWTWECHRCVEESEMRDLRGRHLMDEHAIDETPPTCECDEHAPGMHDAKADCLVTRAGKRIAVCDHCTLPGDDLDDRDLNPDWAAWNRTHTGAQPEPTLGDSAEDGKAPLASGLVMPSSHPTCPQCSSLAIPGGHGGMCCVNCEWHACRCGRSSYTTRRKDRVVCTGCVGLAAHCKCEPLPVAPTPEGTKPEP